MNYGLWADSLANYCLFSYKRIYIPNLLLLGQWIENVHILLEKYDKLLSEANKLLLTEAGCLSLFLYQNKRFNRDFFFKALQRVRNDLFCLPI